MQTIEALQRDLNTAADLQSIVRTMKVLAAVSIRQYERALESLAEYRRTVELGLQVVLQRQPALPTAAPAKLAADIGAVIFGSDHGLCGRFNESIVAFALQHLHDAGHDSHVRHILVVGARIDAAVRAMGQDVEESFFVPGSVEGITATVQQILMKIDQWREDGIGRVTLFHNMHQQKAGYKAQAKPLLPFDPSRYHRLQNKPWPSRSLPMHTMPAEKLLRSLVRQHLFIVLFSACAESLAGEHATRLQSMQVAEKNIQQRLESLTADYRQQRQNRITEELLDVVSGFVSMQERE